MSTPLINRLHEFADRALIRDTELTMREAAAELKSLGEYKQLLQFLDKRPATLDTDGCGKWSLSFSTATESCLLVGYESPVAALRAYKRWCLAQDKLAKRRDATIAG